MLPMTAAFLILALVSLAYRAKTRRGYQPLALGMLAAMRVVLGKFVLFSDLSLYAGVMLLVGASLWNAGSRPSPTRGTCPAGLPAGPPNNRGRQKVELIMLEKQGKPL